MLLRKLSAYMTGGLLVTSFLITSVCNVIAAEKAKEEQELTPECIKMQQDLDANLAEQHAKGCPASLAQMSKLMDNPLGNVAMLFTQFDFFKMTNDSVTDQSEIKSQYMGIAQFPKGLGENWNLINRVVWSVPSMPLDQDKIDAAEDFDTFGDSQGYTIPPTGTAALPVNLFEGRTTGFGDMYYVGLFSPKKPIKYDNGAKLLWGLGFDAGFPTASEDILGTGKWTAGPSGLLAYMGTHWKIGGLLQQYWDYAGDDDRDGVNLTNFQYFLWYSFNATTSMGMSPNIIADWNQDSNDRWTVPIGLGLSRTIQFGKVPVRFGLEAHYSVIQPDNVPSNEWNIRFYIIPAAPSFFFKWMQ